MSELCQQTGPFDPIPPDESVELAALKHSLCLSQGFSLLFARCNQADQRRRLVAALRQKLPQFRIQEIVFDRPILHLLDELRFLMEEPAPDAIFVSGLEHTLPVAAKAHATPLVANLNASRNSFSVYVPCPLVLWVPEYILTAIARGAPDFFSVRSGLYHFSTPPQQLQDAIRTMDTEDLSVTNLPLEEKQKRVQTILGLLAEYSELPEDQANATVDMSLKIQLANLYRALYLWSEAESVLTELLHTAQQTRAPLDEGAALNNLGLVYQSQGRWQEAITSYEQSLVIKREYGDRVGEGAALNNLGLVYQSQGRWQEAITSYEQSLVIKREYGDRMGEGQTLNNLGNVYEAQGRWQEAIECYEQSLVICHEYGDRMGEGQTLNNLGIVYRAQGRWQEAMECYEQDLAICREYGDRVGEGKTLENIALLYSAQGDTEKALDWERQALEVLQTTQDARAVEKAQRLIERWEGLQAQAEE
jgi:tetratricopeptide (TPR) repeat protein